MNRALAIGNLGLIVALVLVGGFPQVDNSIEALLQRDDPQTVQFRAFQEMFGADEAIVLRLSSARLERLLPQLSRLEEALKDSVSISQTISAGTIFEEELSVLRDPELGGLSNLKRLRPRFEGPLGSTLALLTFPSEDEKRFSATIWALSKPASVSVKEALEKRLVALDQKAPEVRMQRAGGPLLNLALDRAGREVERTALPLLVLTAIGFLLLSTRSARTTALLLMPVGLIVAASDASLSLLGIKTNLIINIAKPLLFVLLLASAVHIEVAYEDQRAAKKPRDRAAWDAALSKARPTLLALTTTALGFASLALSEVGPIRVFGLLVAGGLILGAPMVLLSLPYLLSIAGGEAKTQSRFGMASVAARMVNIGISAKWTAPLIAMLVIGLGGAALTQVQSDPHAIRYFSKNHPVRKDHEALSRAGLGLQSVELLLTAPAEGPDLLSDFDRLTRLDALAQSAQALKGVTAVVSPLLFLREAGYRSAGRPSLPSGLLMEQALQSEAAKTALSAFLSKDRRTMRLSVMIETLDAGQLNELNAQLFALCKAQAPALKAQITGNYGLLLQAQRSLLNTLQSSLLVTALLMELILIFALGSIRLALVALVPNLLPVTFNLALMTAIGIPLDLGTSMTGAIALGIAVDDTLHFMLAWREKGPSAARSTGRALILSSVVISAGFLVLVTSSFAPTRNFGLLCAVAMLTALFADLLVLPALLSLMGDGEAGSE